MKVTKLITALSQIHPDTDVHSVTIRDQEVTLHASAEVRFIEVRFVLGPAPEEASAPEPEGKQECFTGVEAEVLRALCGKDKWPFPDGACIGVNHAALHEILDSMKLQTITDHIESSRLSPLERHELLRKLGIEASVSTVIDGFQVGERVWVEGQKFKGEFSWWAIRAFARTPFGDAYALLDWQGKNHEDLHAFPVSTLVKYEQ